MCLCNKELDAFLFFPWKDSLGCFLFWQSPCCFLISKEEGGGLPPNGNFPHWIVSVSALLTSLWTLASQKHFWVGAPQQFGQKIEISKRLQPKTSICFSPWGTAVVCQENIIFVSLFTLLFLQICNNNIGTQVAVYSIVTSVRFSNVTGTSANYRRTTTKVFEMQILVLQTNMTGWIQTFWRCSKSFFGGHKIIVGGGGIFTLVSKLTTC